MVIQVLVHSKLMLELIILSHKYIIITYLHLFVISSAIVAIPLLQLMFKVPMALHYPFLMADLLTRHVS